MGELSGKVAVVTGASRGIGAFIAARLAGAGASVAVTARTAEEGDHRFAGSLATVVAGIADAGGVAIPIVADLGKQKDLRRVVDTTETELGPIDILVSNAAITYFEPVAVFEEKHYRLMFEVQVRAPFEMAQLVLPGMRERRSGWILNISSGAARHPQGPPYLLGGAGGTVYGMCKAALERFTTGLAAEVAGDGVCVNVVSPGLVETPGTLVHNLVTEATRSRVQPIEYIAEAVFQLTQGTPANRTGRIDYAEPFLKELAIQPAALI